MKALRGLGRAGAMPAAALAVHQLRYLLAYGGGAGAELARQGHSYLHSLAPWIVLALSLAASGFMWALGRALAGHRRPRRYALSLAGLWAVCAGLLIAIYAGQELLEGWLAPGHPAGVAGILSCGGWWAIPAAVLIGLVLATVFHGARWVLDEVAAWRGGDRRSVPAPRRRSAQRPRDAALPRLAPLAAGASGRGPPLRTV